MKTRYEEHTLLMAHRNDGAFKIGHLARARFGFNEMGKVVAFRLRHQPSNDATLVSLEHGEGYDWDCFPDAIFLPLKLNVKDELVEWTLANGQKGSAEPLDDEDHEEFDAICAALQRNFAYLRERALREQPVVIYPHGLPTNAYIDVIDTFFDEPFRAEDYEDWLDETEE